MERMNLLISDLDNTLLGDDRSLEQFAIWYANARARFRLVYSSGRFVESVLDSIDTSMLPEPDAIIGGVGTQIYDVRRATYFAKWPPSVAEWNPHIVQTIGEGFAELRLQPSEFISCHKVSFYGRDLDESLLKRLRTQMAIGGQNISIVYSSNRNLDVLPRECNKGTAGVYLARHWKINPDRTFVAGDSGNDAAMFCVGFRGIVVGNADRALKSLESPAVYLAKDCYAAGVLEGIRYWQSQRVSTKQQQALQMN